MNTFPPTSLTGETRPSGRQNQTTYSRTNKTTKKKGLLNIPHYSRRRTDGTPPKLAGIKGTKMKKGHTFSGFKEQKHQERRTHPNQMMMQGANKPSDTAATPGERDCAGRTVMRARTASARARARLAPACIQTDQPDEIDRPENASRITCGVRIKYQNASKHGVYERQCPNTPRRKTRHSNNPGPHDRGRPASKNHLACHPDPHDGVRPGSKIRRSRHPPPCDDGRPAPKNHRHAPADERRPW